MSQPKDISLDQLRTYLYCGEYYRAYLHNKEIPLWDDRKPHDIMISILIKWVLSYKAKNGLLPTEEETMIKIALAKHIVEKAGHPIIFSSKINDINLTILEFRSYLNQITLQSSQHIERYVRSGVSVMFPVLFTTEDTVYTISHRPLRHFINSPDYSLIALSYPKEQVKVLFIRDCTIEYKTIKRDKLSLDKLDSFYTTALKGLANKIYLPIFACTKMTCPHYKDCYIGK